MKHLYLLVFTAVIIVCLSGCKKDTGESLPLSQRLVGKWRQVSVQAVSYTNGIKDNVTEATGFDSSAYIQFNNNGTVTYGSNEVYTHDGNKGDTFHYTLENNLLKITDDKGIMIGLSARVTITGTKLTLQNSMLMPNTDKGDLTFESNFNFVKVK